LVVVGIDLAGSEKRDTGFCVMDSKKRCKVSLLHTDVEIVSATLAARPQVVSVDAPLFLPKGRKSLEKKGPPHFRECDRELQRMHIRFFPISLGPMRMLAARGIRLRREMELRGLEVVESFPGAIQDILGMPRKQDGLLLLARALRNHEIDLGRPDSELTGDELDAVTLALVGLFYTRKQYRAIGDSSEGLMILPDRRRRLGRQGTTVSGNTNSAT
jgi:predicted nuclease with RNAse H fold